MAYMPAQFLKGGRAYAPVEVVISDGRNHPTYLFRESSNYNKNKNIVYTLYCKTKTVEYSCMKCNTKYPYIEKHGDSRTMNSNVCFKCGNKLRVNSVIEGSERQELMLNQSEVEYLLEGLLIKNSRDISPDVRLKLIKLLSFETREEVLDYLHDRGKKS